MESIADRCLIKKLCKSTRNQFNSQENKKKVHKKPSVIGPLADT